MTSLTRRYFSTPNKFTLWIKKHDQEGNLRWYPKRTRISQDAMLDIQNRAEIDYGVANFYILLEGVKPSDEWLIEDQKAQDQKATFSVWAAGSRDGSTSPQLFGEHLNQEAAKRVKKLTEANPLASGLRVWIEEEQ